MEATFNDNLKRVVRSNNAGNASNAKAFGIYSPTNSNKREKERFIASKRSKRGVGNGISNIAATATTKMVKAASLFLAKIDYITIYQNHNNTLRFSTTDPQTFYILGTSVSPPKPILEKESIS